MSNSMEHYYQARAPEFESVYEKPERQADLAKLRSWLEKETRGATVLEIACGTGYWTGVAVAVARAITATDFNAGPLEIARSKGLGPDVVSSSNSTSHFLLHSPDFPATAHRLNSTQSNPFCPPRSRAMMIGAPLSSHGSVETESNCGLEDLIMQNSENIWRLVDARIPRGSLRSRIWRCQRSATRRIARWQNTVRCWRRKASASLRTLLVFRRQ